MVEALYMPDDGRAPRQPAERSRKPRESQPQWPCLLPSIAVAIAPLRNLTSHPQQQFLVDDFTDRLVIGLFRSCRGFTFTWVAGERRLTPDLSAPDPSELRYVVSGSVQQGSSQGMLRANIRISDAVTADYLWVCREEFRPEQLTSIETKITGLISRVLHMLVLHEASRRATVTLDTELGATELRQRNTHGRASRRSQRRGSEMVPRRVRSRRTQCRSARRCGVHLPVSCQQSLVGRSACQRSRSRRWSRGRCDCPRTRTVECTGKVHPRHAVLCGRTARSGRFSVPAGACDG